MKTWLAGVLLLSVAGLSGCGFVGRSRLAVPGRATFEEAASALREQAAGFEPTQINGTCKLEYRDEDGKWRRLSPFDMKLWLEPPYNLYAEIFAAFGPEGKIFFGANQESFWLSIKPEINTYWFGRWNDMQDVTELELDPRVVLESLGMIQFAPHETWQLENQRGQDVLICSDTASGREIKRLFVNTKKYQLSRILYYDELGEVSVAVEMERYKVVDGKNGIPTGIRVTRYVDNKREGRVTFALKQGRLRKFTDMHRRRMFQPIEPTHYNNYDQVYVAPFGSVREQ